MGANCEVILFPPGKSGKISKWKVKEGAFVSIGRVLLLYYINAGTSREELKKLKATQMGMVRKLLAEEGETITPGAALLELEDCTHPTVMNAMCAECGADLRTDNLSTVTASVPMVHSIPELKVSREQAESIGRSDKEHLLKHRKLVLLVDLDQTLIHTTNDNIPANLKDIYHFQLYGPVSPWYHTRIRPGTHKFLKEMSQFFELHICTFGARNYAHRIATFLDENKKYFSNRILSRDECFNSNSKTANLSALFPCGDNMVCIIDDREDVWNFAPNLIHVKAYHFFKHTGDINAPPGLAKHENDDKEGFDFDTFGKEEADTSRKEEADTSKHSAKETKTEGSKPEADKAVENEVDETETKINKLEGKERDDSNVKTKRSEGNKKAKKTQAKKNIKNKVELKKTTEQEKTKCKENNEVITPNEKNIPVNEENVCKVDKERNSSGTEDERRDENTEQNTESSNDKKMENTSVKANLLKEESSSTEVETKDACDGMEENIPSWPQREEEIEVPDSDDYLLYLEEILKTIHRTFYEMYDDLKSEIPDLKNIIPYVRRKVLFGTNLVFSGLVPTNVPLEKSRVFQVARALGAQVSVDISPDTTHLVAVRSGTAKVNTARKMKNIALVTPEWLWACAERWERVEEKLYPLGRGQTANRHPPPHCGSPEHVPGQLMSTARFIESINPLMSLSSEDIANMDREVEDICNESESEKESEKEEEEHEDQEMRKAVLEYGSSSSSSESLSGGEHPHGWKSEDKGHKRTITDSEMDEWDDDMPSTKFRRGEALPSDVDLGEDESASIGSDEPPDEIDDGEWNMMGAALEREFLSNNGE